MSADYTPPPANAATEPSEPPGEVRADFATWGFVGVPTPDQPMPALIVGNNDIELHLELDPEVLHQLLADLGAQAQYADGSSDIYQEDPGYPPLPRRVSKRAVAASGWPAANVWWRATDANTRIVVAGVIAAVMVLGLLVTF